MYEGLQMYISLSIDSHLSTKLGAVSWVEERVVTLSSSLKNMARVTVQKKKTCLFSLEL